jgi:type II secretory pathway pseudopilin PulG
MVVTIVVVAVLVVIAAGAVWVVRRRRAAALDDRSRARAAIRGMATERRKRSGGTIRGKGQGGDTKTALDAAFGSDTSAGA